jgi:ankyrin repeat protein
MNIVHGSPAVNLDYPEPSALDFFQILHDQCIFDFNITNKGIQCALLTAIRRRTKSVETLRFLSSVGVDFLRIAETGHGAIHWAAEMAYDVGCLEYLCTTAAIENINRQDRWGWTPLHYAVSSRKYGYHEAAFEKISCLLSNGADPAIRGRRHLFFFRNTLPMDEFTPLELSRVTSPALATRFEEEIKRMTIQTPEDHCEDQFFDALEQQM